jgi:hypothetical protein
MPLRVRVTELSYLAKAAWVRHPQKCYGGPPTLRIVQVKHPASVPKFRALTFSCMFGNGGPPPKLQNGNSGQDICAARETSAISGHSSI